MLSPVPYPVHRFQAVVFFYACRKINILEECCQSELWIYLIAPFTYSIQKYELPHKLFIFDVTVLNNLIFSFGREMETESNLHIEFQPAPVPVAPPSYWLTRFMILRLLGIIYAVAFLVAINQIIPLIGSNGLLPLEIYFKQVGRALGSTGAGFVRLPSLFWFAHSDNTLLIAAWIGSVSCIVVAGFANAPILTILWLPTCPLYMWARSGGMMGDTVT
jgi:hypothetical protein